jgi:hypothetical protein
MSIIYPFGDAEKMSEDFVLFHVPEDDWREWEGSVTLYGTQYSFLDDMPGVLLGFVEVDWDGNMTGRSWPAKIMYSTEEDWTLRRAENYEVLKDRYKGGF